MMKKCNTLFTYLFSICLVYTYGGWKILPVDTARILAVETFGGKSHWNYVSAILRVLSNNGHHVTVFTPFPDGERDNYKEVDTSNDFQIFQEMNLTDLLRSYTSPISIVESTRTNRMFICDSVYKSVELNKIMEEKENSNFDVLIIETLGYDCELYLASKLNLPLIYLVSTPVIFEERFISGDIPNPAIISHLCANHAIPKKFVQIFINTALLAYSMILFSQGSKPFQILTVTVLVLENGFLNFLVTVQERFSNYSMVSL
ncbi:uncharacterized protein LOC115033041 [Acyrthosiphon pisum]|uniref:Uncharacterized protein n=1 Tax=Acyrthosiphon pisum TaxID=7029 RepID=A0A8R2JMP1_ACYPI|nr:uncharacterized protein LOC115033041 [Acyrthosiphon pisum]